MQIGGCARCYRLSVDQSPERIMQALALDKTCLNLDEKMAMTAYTNLS